MRVLFIIKTPPPLTGATLINKFVSNINFKNFDTYFIKISYKNSISKKSILKNIFILFKIIYSIIRYKLIKKINYVYFQISPIGLPFLRDCIIVLFLKIINVKIIYHLHGKGIKRESNNKLKKILYKWVFKNSHIISLSKNLSEDLSGLHLKDSISIVNNGIPLYNNDKFKNYERTKLNLLFLSHLQINKGIFIFLEVLKIISTNYRNRIFASIIGSEVDVSLESLKNKLYLYNLLDIVELNGPKYDFEKFEIIYNADILVYPTLNDAFPLVLLEAMQFGIPVIASIEGAIPEIVDDGVTGFLVDKNRPDLIAEKLEILIDDNELRKNMGFAARKKFLENYTLEIFEKNMVETFNKILLKNENN